MNYSGLTHFQQVCLKSGSWNLSKSEQVNCQNFGIKDSQRLAKEFSLQNGEKFPKGV